MDVPALRVAIELSLMPSRVRALRAGPLPEGVPVLLRIVAGDEAAERDAATSLDRPAKVVRDASAFYIEQLLLHSEADSYRVLGARQNASTAELRQNMAILMRWLHPDTNAAEERAVFVNRVNRAWDDLKTPERREAYDRVLSSRTAPVRVVERNSKSRRPTQDGTPRGNVQKRHSQAAPHRVRPLMVSDLFGPAKPGRLGLFRRFFTYLLGSKR
jgi:DnaJ domain